MRKSDRLYGPQTLRCLSWIKEEPKFGLPFTHLRFSQGLPRLPVFFPFSPPRLNPLRDSTATNSTIATSKKVSKKLFMTMASKTGNESSECCAPGFIAYDWDFYPRSCYTRTLQCYRETIAYVGLLKLIKCLPTVISGIKASQMRYFGGRKINTPAQIEFGTSEFNFIFFSGFRKETFLTKKSLIERIQPWYFPIQLYVNTIWVHLLVTFFLNSRRRDHCES